MRNESWLVVFIICALLSLTAGCAVESGGSVETDAGGGEERVVGTDGGGGTDQATTDDTGGQDRGQDTDGGMQDTQDCTDECTMDAKECIGDGYRYCGNFDLDDCTEWSDELPCGEGLVCQQGQCVSSCSDECTAGQRRCGSGVVQGCADSDGDGCLEWVDDTPCGANETCDPQTLSCKRTYPPGPYGTRYGDTMANHCFEACSCQGGYPSAETVCMEDMLGAGAILVTVHTGWCPACAEEAASLQAGLYEPYHDAGLEIMLIYIEDEYRSTDRQSLLRLCCDEKTGYGMQFTVAIDPGGEITDRYFSGYYAELPLNMVLDGDMVIRYQMEGSTWGLESTIRNLLGL